MLPFDLGNSPTLYLASVICFNLWLENIFHIPLHLFIINASKCPFLAQRHNFTHMCFLYQFCVETYIKVPKTLFLPYNTISFHCKNKYTIRTTDYQNKAYSKYDYSYATMILYNIIIIKRSLCCQYHLLYWLVHK